MTQNPRLFDMLVSNSGRNWESLQASRAVMHSLMLHALVISVVVMVVGFAPVQDPGVSPRVVSFELTTSYGYLPSLGQLQTSNETAMVAPDATAPSTADASLSSRTNDPSPSPVSAKISSSKATPTDNVVRRRQDAGSGSAATQSLAAQSFEPTVPSLAEERVAVGGSPTGAEAPFVAEAKKPQAAASSAAENSNFYLDPVQAYFGGDHCYAESMTYGPGADGSFGSQIISRGKRFNAHSHAAFVAFHEAAYYLSQAAKAARLGHEDDSRRDRDKSHAAARRSIKEVEKRLAELERIRNDDENSLTGSIEMLRAELVNCKSFLGDSETVIQYCNLPDRQRQVFIERYRLFSLATIFRAQGDFDTAKYLLRSTLQADKGSQRAWGTWDEDVEYRICSLELVAEMESTQGNVSAALDAHEQADSLLNAIGGHGAVHQVSPPATVFLEVQERLNMLGVSRGIKLGSRPAGRLP